MKSLHVSSCLAKEVRSPHSAKIILSAHHICKWSFTLSLSEAVVPSSDSFLLDIILLEIFLLDITAVLSLLHILEQISELCLWNQIVFTFSNWEQLFNLFDGLLSWTLRLLIQLFFHCLELLFHLIFHCRELLVHYALDAFFNFFPCEGSWVICIESLEYQLSFFSWAELIEFISKT